MEAPQLFEEFPTSTGTEWESLLPTLWCHDGNTDKKNSGWKQFPIPPTHPAQLKPGPDFPSIADSPMTFLAIPPGLPVF